MVHARPGTVKVLVKKLEGSWDAGYALHKHTLSSVYLGENEYGHAQFDTTRSEPGEALFQLKYRGDWAQVGPLGAQLQETLLPLVGDIGLIIPMPASTARPRQPVEEIANELGRLTKIPVFNNIIVKAPAPQGAPQLKNLHTREEKDAALDGRFSINPSITNEGCWNALLLDDLFDTGATMDAVCKTLRTYKKINRVYAASITWK
jgi:predicted amidophosphoribosyltransferase